MPTTPAKDCHRAPPSLPGVTREKDTVLAATVGHPLAQHMERPSVIEVLDDEKYTKLNLILARSCPLSYTSEGQIYCRPCISNL